jgi:hypothetical protein
MKNLCRQIDAIALSKNPPAALAAWITAKKNAREEYAEVTTDSLHRWKMAIQGTGEKAQERNDQPPEAVGRKDGWMQGGWMAGGQFKYMWFMLPEAREHLKKCTTWLVDGTFWTCPKTYQQLWNVMGYDGRTFVPCAHFLLPNQKTETFAWAMLELLNYLADGGDGSDIAVGQIITDFEKAERNGISLAFSIFFDEKKRKEVQNAMESPIPTKRINLLAGNGLTVHKITFSGCLFHFSQAIVRFCASNYKVGHKHRAMAQRFLAFFLWLPYFEISEIIGLFMEVDARANECREFVEYFYNTWMCCISWWKVEAEEGILTNGGIECFHRDLKSLFNRAHPNWGSLQDALYLFDSARLEKNKGAGNYDCMKDVGPRRSIVCDNRQAVWEQLRKWVLALGLPEQPSVSLRTMRKLVAEKKVPPEGLSMEQLLLKQNEDFNSMAEENACDETEEGNSNEGISGKVQDVSCCCYAYSEPKGRLTSLEQRTTEEQSFQIDIALNKSIESDRDNDMSIVSMREKIGG